MIRIEHLHIAYGERTLFQDETIQLKQGELTAIIGESGVGKTTLLNVIGLISGFHEHSYYLDEYQLDLKNENVKADIRKTQIAYIFQEHNLHDDLTIEENLMLYAKVSGQPYTRDHGFDALAQVGLSLEMDTQVAVLSGGEYQRLSIACALMKQPYLIIADEMTSALDRENADLIMSLLKKLADAGKMVIVATHDSYILSKCDCVYQIHNQSIQLVQSANHTLSNNDDDASDHEVHSVSLKPFYRWYARFALGKRKWERWYNIVIPAIVIFLCLFFIGIRDDMSTHYHDNLNEFGMNEIFISGDYDISDTKCNQLRQLEGVENVATFTPRTLDILYANGESIQTLEPITVIPYFDFQLRYLGITKSEGAYLSYFLAERYDIQEDMQLRLESFDYQENISVSGILSPDFALVQGSGTLYAIYVPAEIFLMDVHTQGVIHLRDFEAFLNMYDNVKTIVPNHQIILASNDYLTQMATMDHYRTYVNTFITILLILTILFLSISQFFAIKNHKYEISILRANGLSKREVVITVIHLFARDIMKTAGLVALFLIFTDLLFRIMHVSLSLITPFLILVYLLLLIITYTIPLLLTLWMMLRVDIEKMLRF